MTVDQESIVGRGMAEVSTRRERKSAYEMHEKIAGRRSSKGRRCFPSPSAPG